MSHASNDYPVGYCRPPEASRFKAGRSGNPKGRPKGSHNFHTLLDDEMRALVPVIINGRTVKLTKAELAVRQQVDKAAKGDPRAFALLMKIMGQKPAAAEAVGGGGAPSTETELTEDQFAKILASIARDHSPEATDDTR